MSFTESGIPVQHIRYDYTGGTVGTSAYVQITAATSSESRIAEIYDSSTKILVLAQGPAGSETDMMYIPAGGNKRISLVLSKGVRLAVKAVDAAATTGSLLINFFK